MHSGSMFFHYHADDCIDYNLFSVNVRYEMAEPTVSGLTPLFLLNVRLKTLNIVLIINRDDEYISFLIAMLQFG